MAAAITEVSDFPSVVTPEPGDDASADLSKAGDVQEALVALTSRSLYARTGAEVAVFSPLCRTARHYANGATVEVEALGAVGFSLMGALTWRVDNAGATVTAADGDGSYAGPDLPANAWVYIYAYASAGDAAIHFELSTTAPRRCLDFKTGDASRRYVGCFRTDASAPPKPLAYRAHRGRVAYGAPQNFTGPAVGTGGWVSQTLAALVPPHSHACAVACSVLTSFSAAATIPTGSLALRPGSVAWSYPAITWQSHTTGLWLQSPYGPLALSVSPGQIMEWNAPAAPAGAQIQISVDVVEFFE